MEKKAADERQAPEPGGRCSERLVPLNVEDSTAQYHAELFHTSRLVVVGQLSASIAHEINQPLGAIMSNADAAELMLNQSHPDLDEVRLILADINKDCQRASQVVRQVRALAHKRQSELAEVDLTDLSREVLQLVRPIATRQGVTIRTNFGVQDMRVYGDAVLLRQAILNLLLNAVDALVDVPESQAIIELCATLSQPGKIEIVVRDYGNGVPESQLSRLFEAFFTTKPDGLGLGLPIVRSIIEYHDGRIAAENHPDGGALFRLILPRVDTPDY